MSLNDMIDQFYNTNRLNTLNNSKQTIVIVVW